MSTQDQNLSLGEFLREAREKRGITLEQIAAATKINVKLLYYIENDQYSELPAKPFVRGFVIAYARFIGLDPKEILTKYNAYLNDKTQERPTHEKGHLGYAFEKKEGDQGRRFLWMTMGSFVILGAVLILIFKPSFKHHKKSNLEKLKVIQIKASPAPTPSMSQVISSGIVTPSPVATPSPSPSPTPSPSHSPSPMPSLKPSVRPDPLNSGADLNVADVKYKIIFKALSDIWVRFRVDEKPTMVFPIRKDRILVLKAKKLILFQASDPAHVSFNLNNKGHKTLDLEKNTALFHDIKTLVVPLELSETIKEPFKGSALLPKIPPPQPRTASSPPTQNQ
ncbi:MAG: helix-turn-helix domain-containing protein [Deltaproteobacteria bacterium]|nr:helix-turn-helix domain-containing protein [Deltaproteobacteria bacterium]